MVYEAEVGASSPAFVGDHRVQGRVVLPATAYLEAFLAAAHEVLGTDDVAVEDVTPEEAMLLEEGGASADRPAGVRPGPRR